MWCPCLGLTRREMLQGLTASFSVAATGCAPRAPGALRASADSMLEDAVSLDLHSHPGMVRSMSRASIAERAERMGKGRVGASLFSVVSDGPVLTVSPEGRIVNSILDVTREGLAHPARTCRFIRVPRGDDSMPTPRQFTIHVPDETLADLRVRLERTRWPDENPGDGWQYGSNLGYMKALATYWREKYDWRAHEARLNRLRQFVTSVDGIDLHFIHESGVGPNPLPLLLSHGWPGSIVEFERLIPLLTDPGRFGGDPADAFTIVAPSLPGYALSFRPNQPRFNIARIADVFARLMVDVLGYRRFGAQGGDWGAFISAQLGAAHADQVLGVHVTLLSGPREALPTPQTDEERAYVAELQHWVREEQGYGMIQGTKPQTLAYGLTDSPVGLAAWMVEKFRTWSDCDGDVERRFSKDVLLTNVMLYWVTGAINSSFWPYWARRHEPWPISERFPVRVPTAYAAFPKEILHPPRAWVEAVYPNIVRWTRMPAGGHFAALEEPEALAADVRAFFRELR